MSMMDQIHARYGQYHCRRCGKETSILTLRQFDWLCGTCNVEVYHEKFKGHLTELFEKVGREVEQNERERQIIERVTTALNTEGPKDFIARVLALTQHAEYPWNMILGDLAMRLDSAIRRSREADYEQAMKDLSEIAEILNVKARPETLASREVALLVREQAKNLVLRLGRKEFISVSRDTYTPDVEWVKGSVLLAFPLGRCSKCHNRMVNSDVLKAESYLNTTQEKIPLQLERANIRVAKSYTGVCTVCFNAGRETFTCINCKEERSSDQHFQNWGEWEQGDILCLSCWNTMSASAYDALEKRMYEVHQYDHI